MRNFKAFGLVLLSLLILIPLISMSPEVNADSVIYWARLDDNTWDDWTEVGSNPFLDDTDGSYIWTSTDVAVEGSFLVDYSTPLGVITDADIFIEIRCSVTTRNDEVLIESQIVPAGWNTVASYDPDNTAYDWVSFDVSGDITSWDDVNSSRFRFTYDRVGSPATSDIFIRRMYLNVTYTPPSIDIIWGLRNQTVVDLEPMEYNVTFEMLPDTSTFDTQILSIDDVPPVNRAFLNVTYVNGTGFSELDDPNNYLSLDTVNSYKIDHNATHISLIYIFHFNPSMNKEGSISTMVFTNHTVPGANDTETGTPPLQYLDLTIRNPEPPTLVYGAGFNASSPVIELYWVTGELASDTHGENSSDGSSWSSLFNTTLDSYNDTSSDLLNGTYRFYRIRSNRITGVGNKTSSWVLNAERVYFVRAGGVAGPGPGPGAVTVEREYPWVALSIIFSIVGLLLGRDKF